MRNCVKVAFYSRLAEDPGHDLACDFFGFDTRGNQRRHRQAKALAFNTAKVVKLMYAKNTTWHQSKAKGALGS